MEGCTVTRSNAHIVDPGVEQTDHSSSSISAMYDVYPCFIKTNVTNYLKQTARDNETNIFTKSKRLVLRDEQV